VRFCEVANVGKIVNERVSVSFGEIVSEECVQKYLSEGRVSECVR